jgi:creatinine amidohydrolase
MRTWLLLLCGVISVSGQTSREINDLNWMEFGELVPAQINTVLVPIGTIEAHGVANNGADNTAPLALARTIAPRVNALVAPVLPYGITGRLDAFAGSFTISEAAFKPFVAEIIKGLAKNGFQNIILVNGHGGNTDALNEVSERMGRELRVRTMVINWWAYCSDVTLKVFGEDGGHAGWNENAFIQAIDPKLIQKQRYSDQLAMPRPAAGAWSAYPFPSSIILYQAGQGYVKFDQPKADQYYREVCDKVAALVRDTIAKWDAAKIFQN